MPKTQNFVSFLDRVIALGFKVAKIASFPSNEAHAICVDPGESGSKSLFWSAVRLLDGDHIHVLFAAIGVHSLMS